MDGKKLRDRMAGQTRFPEDMKPKRMLYALLVYANEAPGILEEIKIPGISPAVNFFMASDIPGKNELLWPDAEIPVLADKEILYRGQAIGVLTGSNPDELYNLRKNISLTMKKTDPFPPLTPEEERAEPASCESSSEAACTLDKGNTSQAFEQAVHIREETFSLELPEIPVYPGQDVLCIKKGGRYHLHLHCQWPSLVRKLCALAAGISRKQIVLHFPATGRGWDAPVRRAIPQAALAVCLTSILREPVRVIGEDPPPEVYKIFFRYRGALDEKARLLALESEVYLEVGAYESFSIEVMSRLCLGAAGFYKCPNLKIRGWICKSNKAPWLPPGSWGLAQGNLALEVFINNLIMESLEDPGQWRIRHLPVPGNINNTGGEWKKTCPLKDMINQCSQAADFKRKHAAARQLRIMGNSPELALPRYRGSGIATARQGYEFVSRNRLYTANALTMTLQKEGHLDVHLGSIPAAPALLIYWQKMIASRLSLDEEKINLIMDTPDEQTFHGPSCLSRNVRISTRLIEQCCEFLLKRRFREALPISLTRSYRRRNSEQWNARNMTGRPFSSSSWACCIMELSIQAATKEIRIHKIWLYLECGPLLDASAARSYVEAEIRLALSQCLAKEAVLPCHFPELTIHFNQNSRKTPGGLEGLALGCIPAAFTQAVSQACGCDIKGLPLSPAPLLTGEFSC